MSEILLGGLLVVAVYGTIICSSMINKGKESNRVPTVKKNEFKVLEVLNARGVYLIKIQENGFVDWREIDEEQIKIMSMDPEKMCLEERETTHYYIQMISQKERPKTEVEYRLYIKKEQIDSPKKF